jgi:hypothetical protein
MLHFASDKQGKKDLPDVTKCHLTSPQLNSPNITQHHLTSPNLT